MTRIVAVMSNGIRIRAGNVGKLQLRIHDLFWKNHRIGAVILRDRFT